MYEELERGEAVLLDRGEEARGAVFTLAIQYIILKVGALYSRSSVYSYEELERGEAVLLESGEEARGAVFTLAIQYIILKVTFLILVSHCCCMKLNKY